MEDSAEISYNDIPREILAEIYRYCDAKSQLSLAQTNKMHYADIRTARMKLIAELFPALSAQINPTNNVNVDKETEKNMRIMAICAKHARDIVPVCPDDAGKLTDQYRKFVTEYVRAVNSVFKIPGTFFPDNITINTIHASNKVTIGTISIDGGIGLQILLSCDSSNDFCLLHICQFPKDNNVVEHWNQLNAIVKTFFTYILPVFPNVSEIKLWFDHHAIAHIPDYTVRNITTLTLLQISDTFPFELLLRFTALKSLTIMPKNTYNIPESVIQLSHLQTINAYVCTKFPDNIAQLSSLNTITLRYACDHTREQLETMINAPIKHITIDSDQITAIISLNK